MIKQIVRFASVVGFACFTTYAFAADPPGLITVPSNNSVADTIQRFEDAVKASGWMVFRAASRLRMDGLVLGPPRAPERGTLRLKRIPPQFSGRLQPSATNALGTTLSSLGSLRTGSSKHLD
jgi:hypothetical protein